MTEGQFIDCIIALGFVVTDDESQSYYIRREYNASSYIAALPRQQLQSFTERDVDQLITLGLAAEAAIM